MLINVAEDTTINCTTSAKSIIKEDDLDLHVYCNVHNFQGDIMKELTVKWTFVYEKETAELETGQKGFQREAGTVSLCSVTLVKEL